MSTNKQTFSQLIENLNLMYKLPSNDVPTLNIGEEVRFRLANFQATLLEELEEVMEIRGFLSNPEISKYLQQWSMTKQDIQHINPERLLDIITLVMIADWLGDIQVYCASEMKKYGLPNDEVLATIMDSNFSKLGSDGLPIYNDKGKVLKGPNYFKPEKALFKLIAWKLEQGNVNDSPSTSDKYNVYY